MGFRALAHLPTNIACALTGKKQITATEYEFGQLETYDVPTDGLAVKEHAGVKCGCELFSELGAD